MSSDSIAVGIDLGTTYSCVAAFIKGKVIIIPNEFGEKTTPSYVAFDEDDGSVVVGQAAKPPKWRSDPGSAIFDAKRLIGRTFSEAVVQNDIKMWPFKVVKSDRDIPKINFHGKTYFAEEISARVLLHMKKIAESHLNITIKSVVITVPAYFNNKQRQATKDAGEIAGLKVLKVINEPTAAAIAYHFKINNNSAKNVLVFDLGGGTFDVTVLTMCDGDIQVKAIGGDTHLGGQDFDNELVKYGLDVFQTKPKTDILKAKNSASAKAISRLRDACEHEKINLSSITKTKICIDAFYKGLDLVAPVTREQFEKFNDSKFQRCMEIVTKLFEERNQILNMKDIDDIVLVGGSSRIPKIQTMLSHLFGGKSLTRTLNPDKAVAYGAAVQASLLNGKQAEGCLMTSKLSMKDVTSLSIGLKDSDTNEFRVIIPQNTAIPVNGLELNCVTQKDMQINMIIKVFEGEDPDADRNSLLGEFTLENIPPAKQGEEKVVVKMSINHDGILHVTATATSNRSFSSITISSLQGLSVGEIYDSAQRLRLANTLSPNPAV